MPTMACKGRYEGRKKTPAKGVEVLNRYNNTRMFSTAALVFLSVLFCITAMSSDVVIVVVAAGVPPTQGRNTREDDSRGTSIGPRVDPK